MPETNLLEALRKLEASGTRFIVVGGLAAVLNGAPIQTYDIDLVYARTQDNIERLLTLLESLDAIFRLQPARRLRPAASHLAGGGHLNLLTSVGPIDLLATIGRHLSYDDLLAHSIEVEIEHGIRIKILDLETLIAVKEDLAGEKDVAVLPVLRQTLAELKRRNSRSS